MPCPYGTSWIEYRVCRIGKLGSLKGQSPALGTTKAGNTKKHKSFSFCPMKRQGGVKNKSAKTQTVTKHLRRMKM